MPSTDVSLADYAVEHLLQHLAVFVVVYAALYEPLYRWFRPYFGPMKHNPAYPPGELVRTEVGRSLCTLVIGTAFDVAVFAMHQRGCLPHVKYDDGEYTGSAAWGAFLAVMNGLWGDFHFFWTHRMLHEVPWLYRHVHKVHHESHNPNPWSGMSFHPIEGAIYMSSTFGIFLFPGPVPWWIYRGLVVGLIIGPAFGHVAHDRFEPLMLGLTSVRAEGGGAPKWDSFHVWLPFNHHHWLHHAKFNYNYGGFPLWDVICGTRFTPDREGDGGERAQAAREQAALVDHALPRGARAQSVAKRD